MHALSGAFNSQLTPEQMALNSLQTRLYNTNNNRGPFFYPESPYSLGDIAPISAMQPIDDDTLFTPALTPGLTATSVAPVGSVGAQTFQAQSPTAPGTTLGPSGTTLPLLTPFTTNGSPNPTLSYTSPYDGPGPSYPPAYNPDDQMYSLASGGPLAPIPTLTSPPTIYYNPATGQPFAVPATGASIIPGGTYWDPTTGQEYLIPFGGGQLPTVPNSLPNFPSVTNPSSINSPARILTSMLPTPSTSQTTVRILRRQDRPASRAGRSLTQLPSRR